MTTWVCVLKLGGEYDPGYVAKLARGLGTWDPTIRLLCLTDYPGDIPGVRKAPLLEGWPGWWSKMELFRPHLLDGGQLVIYLDLDTVVVGDPKPLTEYEGDLCVLSDLYRPEWMIGSGVMLWRGTQMIPIWDRFSKDPEAVMKKHVQRSDHFLHPFVEGADRVQDIWPGLAVSYKKDCRNVDKAPRQVSLICFHGRPRPADLPTDHWAYQAWEGWNE